MGAAVAPIVGGLFSLGASMIGKKKQKQSQFATPPGPQLVEGIRTLGEGTSPAKVLETEKSKYGVI